MSELSEIKARFFRTGELSHADAVVLMSYAVERPVSVADVAVLQVEGGREFDHLMAQPEWMALEGRRL